MISIKYYLQNFNSLTIEIFLICAMTPASFPLILPVLGLSINKNALEIKGHYNENKMEQMVC